MILSVAVSFILGEEPAQRWNVPFSNVETIAWQDGKVLVGGQLYREPPNDMVNVVRFTADGLLDNSFTPIKLRPADSFMIYANVRKLLVLPDTRFVRLGGYSLMARHFQDGLQDSSFKNPGLQGHEVLSGALQSNGKILLAGVIAEIAGGYDGIFRVNTDGSFDNDFRLRHQGYNSASLIEVDAHDRIVTNPVYREDQRLPHVLMRFDPQGNIDPSFQPLLRENRTHDVTAFASQTDGKILVADVTIDQRRFFRLNENGTIDSTFISKAPNDSVRAILPQGDEILVAGRFTRWGDVAVPGIARLNSSGQLDESFYRGGGTDGPIQVLFPLPNGDILAGGNFRTFNGIAKDGLIQLNSNPVFLRNVAIKPGLLTFTVNARKESTIHIQSSLDLETWTSVYLTIMTESSLDLSLEINAESPVLFLRGRDFQAAAE
jgi:uncharacterized delta-60 repeat protein